MKIHESPTVRRFLSFTSDQWAGFLLLSLKSSLWFFPNAKSTSARATSRSRQRRVRFQTGTPFRGSNRIVSAACLLCRERPGSFHRASSCRYGQETHRRRTRTDSGRAGYKRPRERRGAGCRWFRHFELEPSIAEHIAQHVNRFYIVG